jgi:hypothetical protein
MQRIADGAGQIVAFVESRAAAMTLTHQSEDAPQDQTSPVADAVLALTA